VPRTVTQFNNSDMLRISHRSIFLREFRATRLPYRAIVQIPSYSTSP
jgi:hypothetical protein